MAKPEATPEELSSPKKEKTSSWVKENTRNQMAVISTEEKIMRKKAENEEIIVKMLT